MTQVIKHDLGHKIVHNPGYDFDLGYEKNLNFFITQVLNLLYTCVIQIYFYSLGQNHNLGYEQFYTLGYDL